MLHRGPVEVSLACLLSSGLLLLCGHARAQRLVLPGVSGKAAKTELPKDRLGRSTPRGTVLGFLPAGHKGDHDSALRYLNTPLRRGGAAVPAHQLSVFLGRRLYS